MICIVTKNSERGHFWKRYINKDLARVYICGEAKAGARFDIIYQFQDEDFKEGKENDWLNQMMLGLKPGGGLDIIPGW